MFSLRIPLEFCPAKLDHFFALGKEGKCSSKQISGWWLNQGFKCKKGNLFLDSIHQFLNFFFFFCNRSSRRLWLGSWTNIELFSSMNCCGQPVQTLAVLWTTEQTFTYSRLDEQDHGIHGQKKHAFNESFVSLLNDTLSSFLSQEESSTGYQSKKC